MSLLLKGLELTNDLSTPPTPPVVSPALPSSGVPIKPQMQVRPSCAWLMDQESKTVKVWIIGKIGSVDEYITILGLLINCSPDYTVHMYINSRGGSVSTGCHILSAMERCKARIVTYNIGIAASCGSLILAFGDKIRIEKHAITMFHNAGMGSFNTVHRLITQAVHLTNQVQVFFAKMRDRGLITEEEIVGIVKQGQEYFITESEMRSRLQTNGLWYEGDEQ